MARIEAICADDDAYQRLLEECDRLLEKEIREQQYPMAFETSWLDTKD